MNCDEVQALIEDYHYGELDAEKADRLEAHISKCNSCGKILEALGTEDDIYHRYADAVEEKIEVSPEIWQGVRRGISAELSETTEPSGIRGFTGRFLSSFLPGTAVLRQAAFALSLVVLSIAGTIGTMKLLEDPAATRIEQSQLETDQKSLEYAVLTIQRAEREYLTAIETLGDLVANLQPPMEAALRAELEQNLQIIDENIDSIREACYAHPTDPELAHYLLAAYSRKVELLQEFAAS